MNTIAFAAPGETTVRAWCEYESRELPMRFTCINGAWDGVFDGANIHVLHADQSAEDYASNYGSPAAIVWEGEVPHPHSRNYNDAIAWINEQVAMSRSSDAKDARGSTEKLTDKRNDVAT